MGIYIVLLITVILFCILENHIKTVKVNVFKIESKVISFWVCFIFIYLIGIFRAELLGVDVDNYKAYFGMYSSYDFLNVLADFKSDNGYIMLNKIIYLFTDDFWAAKGIMYSFVFGLYSYIIYKKSEYPALSYLIYLGLGFLGFNFCILRQAIAVSICFYSFQFVKEKRLLKFIVLVLIATTFHKTAIFFAVAYPLINSPIKNDYLNKILLVFLFVICGMYVLPLMMGIYSNDYSNIAVKGEGINLLIFYTSLYFLLIYISKRCNRIDKKDAHIAFIPVCFQIIAFFFSLFSRIVSYYSILLSLIIPNIMYKTSNKHIYLYIIIIIFSFMYMLNILSNSTGILPYKTYIMHL